MRSEAYGEYYRDCFIIKLNVDLDLTNLGNSDDSEHFGTFIHEYFHFLQNMATTFGAICMATFYAKIIFLLHKLATCENDVMTRIVVYDENLDRIIAPMEIAIGDMDQWSYEAYDFISINSAKFEKDELFGEYAGSALPQINLLLVKGANRTCETLNFGAMCIMESMADMLERKIYGKSKAKEYVQYDICEKLWEYMLGKEHSPEIIFRCCEYSLMYENPGQMFFCALSWFKANKIFVTKKAIDDFFINYIDPNYLKTYDNWHDEMLRLFSELESKSHVYTQDLANYVISFCNKFHKLREIQPLFFTDLFESEREAAKIKIFKFTETACPLVITQDNVLYNPNLLDVKKLGMEEFAAFYALYRLFTDKPSNHCVLVDICKANGNIEITESCTKNPLLSIHRKQLCMLGQFLYRWGVKVKELI